MAYTDLREWITKLDKAGELRRIREAVSPHLEMAEIADRTARRYLCVELFRTAEELIAGDQAA